MLLKIPLYVTALIVPVSQSLSADTREDPRFQVRYVEEINREADTTKFYRQPESKQPAAKVHSQKLTAIEQALQRFRRSTLALPE